MLWVRAGAPVPVPGAMGWGSDGTSKHSVAKWGIPIAAITSSLWISLKIPQISRKSPPSLYFRTFVKVVYGNILFQDRYGDCFPSAAVVPP